MSASAPAAAEQSFSIPPQTLDAALNAFGEQSGLPLLYRKDLVATAQSPGVNGRFEPEAALRILLGAAPFEPRRLGRGFVVVRVRGGEASARPRIPPNLSAHAPQDDPPPLPEVVVTGTLVRGVTPAGSQVLSLGADEIERLGIVQPNQIFGAIPQMAGFNTLVRTQTALQGVTVYRPNIRALPPLQNGTTLVLLDSHNLVGSPVQQNFADIGMLPAAAIERVEVSLDGGSATYGSDAVGGIVNFITRSHFEGAQVKVGTGGAAGGYRAHTIEGLTGTDWRSGGAVFAFSSRQNNALLASSRSLPRQDLTSFGYSDFRVRSCDPGNLIVSGSTYALPARAPGTLNLCDTAMLGAIAPHERQNAGYGSLSQPLGDEVELSIKGYASSRRTVTTAAQLGESAAVIDRSNPFFAPIGSEARQTVAFSWAPVLGPTTASEVRLNVYDLAPSLTWRLPGAWQAKFLIDYGRSDVTQKIPQINTIAENLALRGGGLTTATALNPYDLTATNPAVLRSITDYWNYSRNLQTSLTGRFVLDGPIAHTSGGDVRFALGFQSQKMTSDSVTAAGPVGDLSGAVTTYRSRIVQAVFGELSAPLVGPMNARPGVQALALNLSARYSDYQSIGGTFDPRLGVSWSVFEGLKLRGNWGRAFVAPGLNDSFSGGIDSTVLVTATTTSLRPSDPLSDRNRPNIVLTGGTGDLKPVTAKTWSLGADYRPAALEGASLSLSYWSVDMKNLIQAGCANSLAEQLANPLLDGACYYYKPSLTTALELTRGYRIIQGSSADVASLYGAGNDPYYIQDRRRRNYGGFHSTGVDFRFGYTNLTDWGGVSVSVGGVRYFTREQQQLKDGAFIDLLAANNPKLQLQAEASLDYGSFTAGATVFHTGGYSVASIPLQTKVDAFTTLNLFMRYTLGDATAVMLNIDNVADAEPPVLNQSGGAAALTLGRYVGVAVKQRF